MFTEVIQIGAPVVVILVALLAYLVWSSLSTGFYK